MLSGAQPLQGSHSHEKVMENRQMGEGHEKIMKFDISLKPDYLFICIFIYLFINIYFLLIYFILSFLGHVSY